MLAWSSMMRRNRLLLFLGCMGLAHAQPADHCHPATLARPIIAAHRGANRLAPENTLWAYRYAIAYGAAMIEFDVQQTRDGRFVSFHDQALDDKTDGTGPIGSMTLAEVRALNAADNDHWRNSAYDPSQIPTLEEVLQLARETSVGIYFDFKGSVRRAGEVAHLAELYGVRQRASFLFYSNPITEYEVKRFYPDIALMFSMSANPLPQTPEVMLTALASRYRYFGSGLERYTRAMIATLHEHCAIVLPNTYGGDVTGSSAGDLRQALAMGADGAQVNDPVEAAAVTGRPVPTVLERHGETICLLNRDNRQGLPENTITAGMQTLETGMGGAVWAPHEGLPVGSMLRFEGTGAAQPSSGGW